MSAQNLTLPFTSKDKFGDGQYGSVYRVTLSPNPQSRKTPWSSSSSRSSQLINRSSASIPAATKAIGLPGRRSASSNSAASSTSSNTLVASTNTALEIHRPQKKINPTISEDKTAGDVAEETSMIRNALTSSGKLGRSPQKSRGLDSPAPTMSNEPAMLPPRIQLSDPMPINQGRRKPYGTAMETSRGEKREKEVEGAKQRADYELRKRLEKEGYSLAYIDAVVNGETFKGKAHQPSISPGPTSIERGLDVFGGSQPILPKPIPDSQKAPIKLKDALGRKFSFPWHISKTWKGMEGLVKQAFLHIDVLGDRVRQGHYDLIGPDGEIILPQIWDVIIQPDWEITMHMWPMPESEPKKEKKVVKVEPSERLGALRTRMTAEQIPAQRLRKLLQNEP